MRALYWADYVPQETLFWHRRVWDAIGSFDESFSYALDSDFILRAQTAGFKFFHVHVSWLASMMRRRRQ